jgi:ATP-dependent Lon protease
VVLPEKNRKDVDEIPAELLQGLELSYVGAIDEALGYTLSPGGSS